MKIDKVKLRSDIENIIGEGVVTGEEIDITADKIMKRLADLFRVVEITNVKEVKI